VDDFGIAIRDRVEELWQYPGVRVGTILVATLVGAKLVEVLLRRTLVAFTRKTASTVDDVIVDAIRRPVFLSLLLFGVSLALRELALVPHTYAMLVSVLQTAAVLIWTSAAYRIAIALLEAWSRRAAATSIVQPRTLPVFEMLVKVSVVGAAVYFLFMAWQVDLTAWLASAGIIGIAVGFAAKDTLANLFSGVFIVADAPYKLGDFIVLDGDLRGQVTKIGLRSTRVLTQDDVEITVPNAVIGNSKIVNETGGTSIRSRITVEVDAAYGSDIDRVRQVLLTCADGVAHVAHDPLPEVRLWELGASGLRFQLLVWLERPAERGRVIDRLNCAIYKQFAAAGIEIPYSKHDVYVKELPPPRT
jgi:MscS family membrane protein